MSKTEEQNKASVLKKMRDIAEKAIYAKSIN
jgi:hypothetical protein